VGTIFEASIGEFSIGGRLYMSEGTKSSCGHTYQGADFSEAVQLYGFGMFF
jgi:hypothetical protein